MPEATPTRRDILRCYQHALLVQSADELASLYAADAVHEVPFAFPGIAHRLEGREQVRATYSAIWSASPARPSSVEESAVFDCAGQDAVIVEQVVSGTVGTTGEPFEFANVLIMRIRDGEIVHVRDYMDGLAITRALGR